MTTQKQSRNLTKAQIREIRTLFKNGNTRKQIADLTGATLVQVYYHLKGRNNENSMKSSLSKRRFSKRRTPQRAEAPAAQSSEPKHNTLEYWRTQATKAYAMLLEHGLLEVELP